MSNKDSNPLVDAVLALMDASDRGADLEAPYDAVQAAALATATPEQLRDELNRRREATAEDVASYLQAEPDMAVEVLRQLRIAEAWEKSYGEWQRWPAVGEFEAIDGETIVPLARVYEDHDPDFSNASKWYVVDLVDVDWDEVYATSDEAKAAVDTHLVADGWALAGGAAP